MNLLLPWWWRYAAVAVMLAMAAGYGALKMRKIDNKRYDALQAEYDKFKADVERIGAEQERKAKETIARYKKIKETVDVENKRLRSDNAVLSKRLLDARSSSGYLPAPAPGSASPNRISFDRAELDGAIRRLDAGVQGLIDEGDTARINLDTAKKWASER